MRMLAMQCTMSDGARREIAIIMPTDSSGSQIATETARKLRDRYGVREDIVSLTIRNSWPTDLPAYSSPVAERPECPTCGGINDHRYPCTWGE